MTIYPDHTSARIGAVGALASLIGRAAGGPGRTVSVAQAEVMLNQFGPEFLAESLQPGSMTAPGTSAGGTRRTASILRRGGPVVRHHHPR